MPSIRKRIGYLPSIKAQEMITKIANKEKLSQSKMVGILVEEALIARGFLDLKNSNDLIKSNLYNKEYNMNNSSINHNDLDEMISDTGITYNTNKYKINPEHNLSEPREQYHQDLFELFNEFMKFQKFMHGRS
tara:strand:- start:180 stop:578 length:399 start_codon:yes stop_codon:yes gene_type:complete